MSHHQLVTRYWILAISTNYGCECNRDISPTTRMIRFGHVAFARSTVALIAVPGTMAGTIVVAHPGLAFLLGISILGNIEYLVFKPALDRAFLDLNRG